MASLIVEAVQFSCVVLPACQLAPVTRSRTTRPIVPGLDAMKARAAAIRGAAAALAAERAGPGEEAGDPGAGEATSVAEVVGGVEATQDGGVLGAAPAPRPQAANVTADSIARTTPLARIRASLPVMGRG